MNSSVETLENSGFERVSVIGLGYFGIAFLEHLGRINDGSFSVVAHARDQEQVEALKSTGSHPAKFSDHKLPDSFEYTHNACEAVNESDLVLLSTPSSSTRDILRPIRGALRPKVTILNTAKALDSETGRRLSEVVEDELVGVEYDYALFAGGTIADEFLNDQPLGANVASSDKGVADRLASFLSSKNLYIDSTEDLFGVELASAMKNVVSVAAGVAQGKGYNIGTETYVISRVAGEIGRVCVQMGASADTFSIASQCWGNDMLMSAIGPTRNRAFGVLLGQGLNPDEALAVMSRQNKTVESVSTISSFQHRPEFLEVPALKILYRCLVAQEVSVDEMARQLFLQ